MGTEQSILANNSETSISRNSFFNSNSNNISHQQSEIYASFVVSKQFELSDLKAFIQQRSKFLDLNQHICGVKGYQLKDYQSQQKVNESEQQRKGIINCSYSFQCEQKMKVFVYYEKFSDYLTNINKKKWNLNNLSAKHQQNSRQSNQMPIYNHYHLNSNSKYQTQQNQSQLSYNHHYSSNHQNSQGWSQAQLYYFIYCITDALQFLRNQNPRIHHGDISLQTICKVGVRYKLIDTYFLHGGISAYQRILQGQSAFISPQQMIELRSGYSRESPVIQQSNDIFALGMTLLELMTGKESKECYKESYLRFQTFILQNRIQSLRKNAMSSRKWELNHKQYINRTYDFSRTHKCQLNKFPSYSIKLVKLLEKMLQMDPAKRITLYQIVKQEQITVFLINKGKISMKQITFF